MKTENLECDIVQDLLPLYLDKKTSEETDKFVEKHLWECETCGQVYEVMNSSLGEELRERQNDRTEPGAVKSRQWKKHWRLKKVLRTGIWGYVILLILLWLYCTIDLWTFFR